MSKVLYDNRLPQTIIPTNYQINIIPNLKSFEFFGHVSISICFLESHQNIILHSKQLKIYDILFDYQSITDYQIDAEKEIISINLEKEQIGFHKLEFYYKGILNNDMCGFYRTMYLDKTGQTKFFASTQFEATDCRRAMPCFDEPSFKATFNLSIESDEYLNGKNLTVLSNMPIKNISKKTDADTSIILTEFYQTPKMSTYLLAFCIGDLEYVETVLDSSNHLSVSDKLKLYSDSQKLPIRIYCTPGNKEKLDYAMQICVKAIRWFEDFFKIPYTLPKLDMLAVPDFAAGAMENWGLITYREVLLFCTSKSSVREKQRIVITICHELAHQWFGNLVTMGWWNNLWLNESMAEWFGNYCGHQVSPELNIWEDYMTHTYEDAYSLDSLESSHPIEVEISKSEDIDAIFDAISYNKGSCLINYFVKMIGIDKFAVGMNAYLTKYAFKNTVSDDLWDCFLSNPILVECMKKLVRVTGYPLISINKVGSHICISQQRFLSDAEKKSDLFYPLILDYMDNHTESRIEFVSNNILINRDSDMTNNQLPIIGRDSVGFYRVNHSAYNLNQYDMVSQIPLWKKANDIFSLHLSGYTDIFDTMMQLNNFFPILSRRYKESNNVNKIWEQITDNLIRYRNIIEYNCQPHILVKFDSMFEPVITNMTQIITDIGYYERESESVSQTNLREIALNYLIQYNYKSCIDALHNMFDTNISSRWYCIKNQVIGAIAKGTDNMYQMLMDMYENECMMKNNPALVRSLLAGLAKADTEAKLHKVLTKEFVFNKIRKQDICGFLAYLSTNRFAGNMMREFIEKQWNVFCTEYKKDLPDIVEYVGNTVKNIDEYYRFILLCQPKGCEMSLEQTKEMIQNRCMREQRIAVELSEYFEKNFYI